MKSLEKAALDLEKAKEKLKVSKARYDADLKKMKECEADYVEAENLEYIRLIRSMNMSISEVKTLKKKMKTHSIKEIFQEMEEGSDDEFTEEEDSEGDYRDENGWNG